jgi:RHS repeat-associated protein
MSVVNYINGIQGVISYDAYGNETGLVFTNLVTRALVAGDQITKSLGGREITELLDTGTGSLVNPNPAGASSTDFSYDGAGRLTQAYLNGAVATYGYGTNPSGDSCANSNEGTDTNRTNVTTTPTSGTAVSTDYCYNSADQLVSTTKSGTTSTTYSYDGQGNQTTDGTTSYTWDSSGRLASATSGSNSVTYTDDALNRLLKTVQGSTTSKYSYSGFSDSPVAELNTSGQVQQQYVSLPGGVQVTVQSSGNTWSYPDLQGDITATTNGSGTLSGTPVTYDPWGSLYPKTQTAPANTNSGASYGAYGGDGKLQQNGIGDTLVFLGARALDPSQGRFLSVDPIDGGCANEYVYVFGDPINGSDLSGKDDCPEGSVKTTVASPTSVEADIDLDGGGVIATAAWSIQSVVNGKVSSHSGVYVNGDCAISILLCAALSGSWSKSVDIGEPSVTMAQLPGGGSGPPSTAWVGTAFYSEIVTVTATLIDGTTCTYTGTPTGVAAGSGVYD